VLTSASGLRITSAEGVFSLELDKSILASVADPKILRYFKVISYGVEFIESFELEIISLIDCSG